MKKFSFYKKITAAAVGIAAGFVMSTAVVGAIPYVAGDASNASPVPAFNVFTGVPNVGDESDFLRSRVPTVAGDSSTPYVDPLAASCEKGQKIQMRVYVHNGASVNGNNNGTGPSVAHDTRVKVALDTRAASTFTNSATISASNAATVNDSATINCNGKTVKLKYVPGSASSFSKATGVVALSDEVVTNGVPVRSHATAGDVYGCFDQRVFVILTVEVEEIPAPKPVTAICDTFRIVAGDNRTIRVSDFKFTAENATYKHTVINWDAGKTNVSSAPITDATKVKDQTYKYGADGTYLVTATVRFATEANSDLAAGTENCQQKVTFTSKQEPVVVTATTPVKPVVLVAAGPASTIATILAITATVAGAYYWSIRRRLV